MADVFAYAGKRLSTYTAHFQLIGHQVGALLAINGKAVGLECFGCQDTFARFFDRLLKATPWMPLTPSTHPDQSPSVPPAVAKAFVTSVQKAEGELYPAVSAGATIYLASRTVAGAALADGRTLLHLFALRKVRTSGAIA